MTAAYVAVARLSSSGYATVLAEATQQTTGDDAALHTPPSSADVKAALAELGSHPGGRTSIPAERCTYHVYAKEIPSRGEFPVTVASVLAVQGGSADRDSCFRFLDRVVADVFGDEAFSDALRTTGEFGLQPELSEKLEQMMERFNRGEDNVSGKVGVLRGQVDEVRQVMQANVERVLERGDRLEELQSRSSDLEASSSQFRVTSHRVRTHLCRQNAKWTIICGLTFAVVFIVLLVVILFETGAIHF